MQSSESWENDMAIGGGGAVGFGKVFYIGDHVDNYLYSNYIFNRLKHNY